MIAIFISCMPLHTPCNYASNPIYFIKFTCPSIFLFVFRLYHFLTFLIICMSLGVNKKIHPWCYSLLIHCKWYLMQLSIKWMAMQCYSIKIQFFICFTKYIFFEIFIIKKWCVQIKLLQVRQNSGIKSDNIFVFPMQNYIYLHC